MNPGFGTGPTDKGVSSVRRREWSVARSYRRLPGSNEDYVASAGCLPNVQCPFSDGLSERLSAPNPLLSGVTRRNGAVSPANTSFYDYKLSPVVSIVRGAIPLSTQSTSGANNFESTLGGYTVSGQAHSLSAWFVLVLRLMMGWVFAWSGATMILGGFDAEGFSFATTANGSPLADLFVSMGNTTPPGS